jgi:signal transduction histidine kinase
MKFLQSVAFAFALATASHAVQAQDQRGTKEEALAMANAAVSHVQKAGTEKAYKDFNDKANAEWHKKDLYVFVNRYDGMTLAHGSNEKLLGKDMSGLKDQDGKPFIQEMIATAKKSGSGWVEYSWVHPETRKLAGKAAYVKALPSGDGFVGVGIYR